MVKITLTDFLQLSFCRDGFEKYFKLFLCVDTGEDEEFIEKKCSISNIISYQDWNIISFDVEDNLTTIYIKKE